ncbi:LOW QUALITY PROTEIN: hypothetical protein CVT26_002444 [Gymnopilus dilepis]|uniref:Transmembrane protein n=1 Tax=Gymnopilus dilepis TaxID=231916 RepID=A0A409Y3L9_9AGAR|nr:LOW QUALITY PROTEIN: hypothetical protein CVT26_002444 [Gymnopilus dilepis]
MSTHQPSLVQGPQVIAPSHLTLCNGRRDRQTSRTIANPFLCLITVIFVTSLAIALGSTIRGSLQSQDFEIEREKSTLSDTTYFVKFWLTFFDLVYTQIHIMAEIISVDLIGRTMTMEWYLTMVEPHCSSDAVGILDIYISSGFVQHPTFRTSVKLTVSNENTSNVPGVHKAAGLHRYPYHGQVSVHVRDNSTALSNPPRLSKLVNLPGFDVANLQMTEERNELGSQLTVYYLKISRSIMTKTVVIIFVILTFALTLYIAYATYSPHKVPVKLALLPAIALPAIMSTRNRLPGIPDDFVPVLSKVVIDSSFPPSISNIVTVSMVVVMFAASSIITIRVKTNEKVTVPRHKKPIQLVTKYPRESESWVPEKKVKVSLKKK